MFIVDVHGSYYKVSSRRKRIEFWFWVLNRDKETDEQLQWSDRGRSCISKGLEWNWRRRASDIKSKQHILWAQRWKEAGSLGGKWRGKWGQQNNFFKMRESKPCLYCSWKEPDESERLRVRNFWELSYAVPVSHLTYNFTTLCSEISHEQDKDATVFCRNTKFYCPSCMLVAWSWFLLFFPLFSIFFATFPPVS